jgi:hypothetical protein
MELNLGRCQEMSKYSLTFDEKGISILMEPEEVENESSETIPFNEVAPRQFVDKFGNVWTEQWLPDLAYKQMIRRLNRLK